MEELKKLGEELGAVAGSVAKALADKKVSLAEGINMGTETAKFGIFVVSNRDAIVDPLKDGLNEVEASALMEGFNAGFSAETGELEADIEAYFEGAVGIATGISRIIAAARD